MNRKLRTKLMSFTVLFAGLTAQQAQLSTCASPTAVASAQRNTTVSGSLGTGTKNSLVKSSIAPATRMLPASGSSNKLLAQDTPALREYMQPLDAQQSANPILEESEQTFGVSFIKPDEVVVKQPLLKALIQLNSNLSPYDLDAKSKKSTQLGEVLKIALNNNLDIKFRNTEAESRKWNYYAALGNFLPTVNAQFNYDTLGGSYASPFGLLTPLRSSNLTLPTMMTMNFFKGGQLIYTAAQTKHQYRAARYGLKGITNDVLLRAANLYYNLVLADVLLQVRIKAVETSAALLARNEDRYANGAVTKLDVLQSKSQLSRDRQALIQQQIKRRQAAIELSTALNLDAGEDLIIENRTVSKIRLVDGQLPVGTLLQIAVDNRPELKKFEELRIAAKDNIRVAFSQLLPQVTGTVGGITTGARVTSGNSAAASSSASSSGVSAGSLLSGVASPSGGSGGGSGRKFQLVEAYELGIGVNWTLGGMGTVTAAQVQSARWEARKAQIEFNRELNEIYKEVRDAYLEVINTENLIAETTDTVNSTREQLEVANIRLEEGVGTDLDAITAQRDYTQALIDKASAIVNFNVAQAKLLRAIGRVSYDSLTALKPTVK